MVGEAEDKSVTPEEVTMAMVFLIENKKYAASTVLDNGCGHTRVVFHFLNPGAGII